MAARAGQFARLSPDHLPPETPVIFAGIRMIRLPRPGVPSPRPCLAHLAPPQPRPKAVTRIARKRTVAHRGSGAPQLSSAGRELPAGPARTGLRIRSTQRLVARPSSEPSGALRHGPAHAAGPRLSARGQTVVVPRSEGLRKVRGSASCRQKPTVDPQDRTPNTQVRVIEIPIPISPIPIARTLTCKP